jgi:hypothetical protein
LERRVHAAEAFVCTLLPPEGGVPLAMKCANVNMNCHNTRPSLKLQIRNRNTIGLTPMEADFTTPVESAARACPIYPLAFGLQHG